MAAEPSTPGILNPKLRHPGLLAWLRLAQVNSRILRATGRRLRRWQLSTMEFDILAHVGGSPGISQQELSAHLFVTEGNVTYQLAKLETRQLLQRVSRGRCKHLYLSSQGQALFDEVVPQQEAWHIAQFSVLDAEEQQQLLRLLRKLERNIP